MSEKGKNPTLRGFTFVISAISYNNSSFWRQVAAPLFALKGSAPISAARPNMTITCNVIETLGGSDVFFDLLSHPVLGILAYLLLSWEPLKIHLSPHWIEHVNRKQLRVHRRTPLAFVLCMFVFVIRLTARLKQPVMFMNGQRCVTM